VDTWEHLIELSEALRRERTKHGWDYIEFRPIVSEPALEGFESSETFFLHKLNLRPESAEIFRGFHKSSTQRKIKRAEREGLVCESGVSERLLSQFYKLLALTRRRHFLPPQPRTWFSNLVRCMGNQLSIWVASSGGIPIASILTLQLKNTLVYKYGGADQRFFNLGGMQMLLWRVIEQASGQGFNEFDLGRSDQEDHGLILFKDRLGANRSSITYFRNPPVSRRSLLWPGSSHIGKRVVSCIPESLLAAGGRLLYKHFG
jgi:lipid II:glycine glycyltransferase (peptidoglycan interpeptide bridge formation enzyme)